MVPVYDVGMRVDGAVAEAVGVVVDISKISQIGWRRISSASYLMMGGCCVLS